VREEIVDVGGMFGILSSPIGVPERDDPTILLPNVGANHHVGCNRVYVDLARHWASVGFRVLRFDLVGIGDTPALDGRPENGVFSDACVTDTRRAMSCLARERGHQRFALVGICSGAYISFRTALADRRVDCVILVNPVTFDGHEVAMLEEAPNSNLKSTRFYRAAARDLETWLRAARGEIHLVTVATRMASRTVRRVLGLPARLLRRGDDVATAVRRGCDRGTQVTVVCGENDGTCDVVDAHLGPGARRLRGHRNFSFAIIPGADHTFSSVSARRELIDELTASLSKEPRVGARPSASNGPRWAPPLR
jgi:pimeloyl-ACP methyl ester carboxylesterase